MGTIAAGLQLVHVNTAWNLYFATIAVIGAAILILEGLKRLHINNISPLVIVVVVALVLAALTSAMVAEVVKAAPN